MTNRCRGRKVSKPKKTFAGKLKSMFLAPNSSANTRHFTLCVEERSDHFQKQKDFQEMQHFRKRAYLARPRYGTAAIEDALSTSTQFCTTYVTQEFSSLCRHSLQRKVIQCSRNFPFEVCSIKRGITEYCSVVSTIYSHTLQVKNR